MRGQNEVPENAAIQTLKDFVAEAKKELRELNSRSEKINERIDSINKEIEQLEEEQTVRDEALNNFDELMSKQSKSPAPTRSFFSTKQKPVIANLEEIQTRLQLQQAFDNVAARLDDKKQELLVLEVQRNALQDDIAAKNNEIADNERQLEEARHPTFLGSLKGAVDDYYSQYALNNIVIPENSSDNETDIEALSTPREASDSDATEIGGADTPRPASNSDATEPYGRESISSTEGDDTTKAYISSSSKKEIEEKISHIEKDKKEFEETIIIIDLINADIETANEDIKSLEQEELYFTSVIPNSDSKYDLFVIPEEVLINEINNYAINPRKPFKEIESELKNSVATLEQKYDRQVIYDNQLESLTPKTGFGRFIYSIARAFMHFFGAKTKLEKTVQSSEINQTEIAALKESTQRIVAKARAYRNDCLIQITKCREDIKEYEKQKSKNTNKLYKKAKEYGITQTDSPRETEIPRKLQRRMISVFEQRISDQKQLLNHEKNIKEALIKRCWTFFQFGATYAVKESLKNFLQDPTEVNLKQLETTMNKNPDYIKDHALIMLLHDAQTVYPEIPRVALVEMNILQINDHYNPKLFPLILKIADLETEKKEIEDSLKETNSKLLERADGIQANMVALERCNNLLVIAKLELIATTNTDPDVTKRNNITLSRIQYLESKIAQIKSQLPEDKQVQANEITNRKAVKYTVNYDVCKEDIENILTREMGTGENVIRLPDDQVLTRDSIQLLLEKNSLTPEQQTIILKEIDALEDIQIQVQEGYNENLKQNTVILQSINFDDNKVLKDSELIQTMENFDIVGEETDEKLTTDQNNIVDAFRKFDNDCKQSIPTALDNLETALSVYKETYREQIGNIQTQIQNIRSVYERSHYSEIDSMIGQISTLSSETALTVKDIEQLKRRDEIKSEITELKSKKERITKARDECIDKRLPPPDTPKDLAQIISKCKSTTGAVTTAIGSVTKMIGSTVAYVTSRRPSDPASNTAPVSSVDQNNFRTALANFLALPTTKNLKELHQAMDKYPHAQRTPEHQNFIETANKYYPQITAPVLTLKADESAKSGSTSFKTRFQALMPTTTPSSSKQLDITEPPITPSSPRT